VLADTRRTAFVFVLIPERLAILETSKAVQTLEKYRVPIGAIVVNRVLPEDADGAFLDRRRARETGYRKEIATTFAHYPIVHVPLRGEDVVGVQALRQLLTQLAADARAE
jgi:arsenite-transporting ATPase